MFNRGFCFVGAKLAPRPLVVASIAKTGVQGVVEVPGCLTVSVAHAARARQSFTAAKLGRKLCASVLNWHVCFQVCIEQRVGHGIEPMLSENMQASRVRCRRAARWLAGKADNARRLCDTSALLP